MDNREEHILNDSNEGLQEISLEAGRILTEIENGSLTDIEEIRKIFNDLILKNIGNSCSESGKDCNYSNFLPIINSIVAEFISVFSNRIKEVQALRERNDRIHNELKRVEEENKLDCLTKVFNRRTLNTDLEGYISEYEKNGTIFSFAILDIDNFKIINDKYGHVFGDKILIQFTEFLKRIFAGYKVDIYRYGGEEFAILGHISKPDLYDILKKLLNDRILLYIELSEEILKSMKEEKGKNNSDIMEYKGKIIEFNITFSGGILDIKDIYEINIDNIINQADRLLYNAKETGKNNIFCF